MSTTYGIQEGRHLASGAPMFHWFEPGDVLARRRGELPEGPWRESEAEAHADAAVAGRQHGGPSVDLRWCDDPVDPD